MSTPTSIRILDNVRAQNLHEISKADFPISIKCKTNVCWKATSQKIILLITPTARKPETRDSTV